MGKGSNTTTTQQSQNYSPTGAGYINSALQRATDASNTGFQAPVAPVAGFSNDQQNAFDTVRGGQGMALPYINSAANMFGRSAQGPDVSAFFNPFAGAVAGNMEDLFGQQRSQNTGDLTQAAGGVGADRIAVGQGELAKQQGLAMGQTMANVYAPSLSAAQQQQQILQAAGYGMGALGPAAQNSVFSGAQAQLGTGGLQQQLSQAQQNAPYQNILARLAYPFQTSNFLSGAVGSLAPGLGGTTSGTGSTTGPAPSLFSQILGLGTAGVGAAGGMGAFNGNKGASYGGGSPWSGDAYGGSSSNPLNGLSPADYGPGFSRGGTIDLTRRHDGSYGDANPYACGGATDDGQVTVTGRPVPGPPQIPGSQPGNPSFGGAGSAPPSSDVPTPPQMQDPGPSQWADPSQAKLTSYAPSLSPPQTSAGDFGKPTFTPPPQPGGFGNKGSGYGRGYDGGGTVSDEPIDIAPPSIVPEGKIPAIKPNIPQLNLSPPQKSGGSSGGPSIGDAVKIAAMFMKKGGRIDPKKFDGYNPYFAAGGSPDDDDSPATFDERFPYRMPGKAAMDDWRSGASDAMAFSGDDTPPAARAVTRAARAAPAPSEAQDVNPYSPATASPAEGGRGGRDSFAASPWAALMAAGLGMAAGKSPFALTNIGTGGLEGLKTLESQRAASQKDETIDQAAKRLAQEADFHQDKYTKMTPYEKGYLDLDRQKSALEAGKPFKIGMDKDGFDIMGVRDPKHPGHFINALTGEAVDPALLPRQPDAFPKTLLASADGIIPANAQLVSGGAYDYTRDAPYTEKGMDVPEPAGVAGRSPRSVQTDAEYYLQTGKLPPVRGGKSPVAVAQQNYRNAVQNYAGALGQSRGITPEQSADMWRTAPGMLRFILGADGRSTVALGTAVRHLDTLKQFSDAWKSGDVQTVNRLRATISREFGSEAATNLEAAGRIVGPEIIKAIGVAGAGTAEERLAAEKGFGTAASPEQINGAIRVTQSLLGGQLEGRKRQANNAGVSDERFKSLVGERPYEVLTGIDKGGKSTATPAAETAPAVGTLKQFKQGMGRWNGTAWEPVQ